MSAERLQAAIRRTKTPVALVLDPREDRLEKKYLKNFTDLYGDCPMAHAEALRPGGDDQKLKLCLAAEPSARAVFLREARLFLEHVDVSPHLGLEVGV